MLETLWILLIIILFFCTWFATIERAMMMTTPLVLRHELEVRGKPHRGLWIEEQYESTLQSISFVKGLCLLSILACFVLMFDTHPITLQAFIYGSAIGWVVIWIFASVIAGSIAKSATIGSITRSWVVIRFASMLNPLIRWWIEGVNEIVRRLTGANLKQNDGLNTVEEQLLRSIEHSQREGGIPAEAAEMLENVVDLSDTDVGEIMTPRTDIEGIECTNDISEIRKFVLESGRSRIPVFEENLDQIIGILYVKDLVGFLGSEANGFELKNILRKPIVVPDTKPVQELLADFQTSEVHMAVVIDEYGGTAGLVTIEDVLEEIVGEIRDEHDDAEHDEPILSRINEKVVEVDGRFNLDDLNDELGINLPEDEEYDTIAGFVLANLGHVPNVGESIEIQDLVFTTIKATETQIERLSIGF
ncbi:MAG: hemolysin family protein [Phycisphaerales bacterium]|jgi:CBS domain containing-hemolysin-like protein|nr:hemolysin family protein [Phycisphaerales bacterium]